MLGGGWGDCRGLLLVREHKHEFFWKTRVGIAYRLGQGKHH